MHQHQILQIKQVLADREKFLLLVEMVPELQRPLYLWTNSRRVAENVAFGDWGLPSWYYYDSRKSGLCVVSDPEHLYGKPKDAKILWQCYGSWNCRNHYVIGTMARERGFTILDDTEFFEWLMKRMHDLAHPQPSGGLLALEALLHRLQSLSQIRATKPPGKAQ